jgi:hypothetical protein
MAAPERLVTDAAVDRLLRCLVALVPAHPWSRRLRVDVVAVLWREGAAPELRHFAGRAHPARGR